jgi:drug/metabolite transporter (DMT)-like permease
MRGLVPLFPALFVLLWATGFIGARLAMPHAEPFTFLALRFGLAAVLIALLAWAAGAQWPKGRAAAASAVAGILIHGIYLGGVFWAIRYGMPAGLSALIIGLQPVLTAVFARYLVGEPLSGRMYGGLALGLAGIAMVIVPPLTEAPAGALQAVTPVTVFACAVAVAAIAFGTVWQKRHAAGTDLRTGTFWQYAGACVVTAAASAAFEDRTVVWTGELAFALAWLTLVLSIGAIFLLMFLIREGAVSKVSSLFYLVPGVTAVMAFALFGETLRMPQIAGLLVAAGGVWLASAQTDVFARRPR